MTVNDRTHFSKLQKLRIDQIAADHNMNMANYFTDNDKHRKAKKRFTEINNEIRNLIECRNENRRIKINNLLLN